MVKCGENNTADCHYLNVTAAAACAGFRQKVWSAAFHAAKALSRCLRVKSVTSIDPKQRAK